MTEGMDVLIKASKDLEPLQEELDRLTTKQLIRRAAQANIEIPKESWHYVKDPDFPGFMPLDWYLKEPGQRTVQKLLKKERRDNIEWWIKVLGPILSLLVAILGLIVAALTIWISSHPSRS